MCRLELDGCVIRMGGRRVLLNMSLNPQDDMSLFDDVQPTTDLIELGKRALAGVRSL